MLAWGKAKAKGDCLNMNYVGIDIHKRYSVLVAVDERGRELRRSRINGNTAFGFAQFFAGLEGPSKVVLEACWNWGRIYDLLSEIEQVEELVLAHPLKTRLIADAQIKTDALDARALATLLRGDLIARAYVPTTRTRQRKEVLRQRLHREIRGQSSILIGKLGVSHQFLTRVKARQAALSRCATGSVNC